MIRRLAPEALRPHGGYLRLWRARVAGTAGQQMMMVALGWQVYDLTGSVWDLGLVGLAQFLPALLLALPAGQLVDRVDRRRVLAACLGTQGAVAVLLASATFGGWLSREAVFALSVALGALRAFQMPAQQALMPSLVPPHALPRAYAFGAAGVQAAVIGGPAAGGVVYALGGAWVHVACTALFLLAAGWVLAIPRAVPRVGPPPAGWADMTAGLRFIGQRPVVLGALSLDLFAVLLGGATALLPVFARDVLHVGPQGLGLLRAAPAVGALAASIWLARRPIERHAGPVLLGAVAVYGACMLVFGASTSFALSLVALGVSGAGDMVSVVVRQTLVQLETPDEMRGRVSAVNAVFIGASNQLGEFESGATAAWLGPAGSVLAGGAGTLLVVALWWRFFPQLARRDRLVPPGD